MRVYAPALLWLATRCFAAQISWTDQAAAPGSTIVVPVRFDVQSDTVGGLQFELQYDSSVMAVTATAEQAAVNAGKLLYFANAGANTKRFIVAGMNANALGGGSVVNLQISVNASASSGSYPLSAANVIGVDPSGNAVAVSAASGRISVSPSGFQVVNGAGLNSGAVAPGEIISVFGPGIGPEAASVPAESATSTSLGEISLLFDGIPAPLLYAGPNQINAIVPYSVYRKTTTQFQISRGSQVIGQSTLQVALAAPAIFSVNASGSGPGAILNQNGAVNSASNPADRSSIVALYATGAGQTDPEGVDGQVIQGVLPQPLLPVRVQIGGVDAEILYRGAAPGLVSGALQVNCRIPASVSPGAVVPIVLIVGESSSPAGVTIAVK